MSKLLQTALAEIGTKEIVGSEHNPRILQYAHEAGFKWVKDDETPWCAIFVAWCAWKNGYSYPQSAVAQTFLKSGKIVLDSPKEGDVVIFQRGKKGSWKGHVAFFVRYSDDGDSIFVCGGNQHNQVCIESYAADRLLGFRRLQPLIKPEPQLTPKPVWTDTSKLIAQFLKDKETEAFKADHDKFEKYPFVFTDANNKLQKGYLQDAVATSTSEKHILELIVLSDNNKIFWHIKKTCIAPIGCEIEWDTVHCALDVNVLNV